MRRTRSSRHSYEDDKLDWLKWIHRLILLLSSVFINLAINFNNLPIKNPPSYFENLGFTYNILGLLGIILFSLYFSSSFKVKTEIKFLIGYFIYSFLSYFVVITRNLNNGKFHAWQFIKNDFFQTQSLLVIVGIFLLSIVIRLIVGMFQPKFLNLAYSVFEDYQSDRSFLTFLFSILIANNPLVVKAFFGDLLLKAAKLPSADFQISFVTTSVIILFVTLLIAFSSVETWNDIKTNTASPSVVFITVIISAIVLNFALQYGVKNSEDLLGYYIMPGATTYQIVVLVALLLIPYLATNRYFPSFLIDVVLGTVIATVNILKNGMRNEPLLVTDFTWLKEFGLLLSFIDTKMTVVLLLVFVVPMVLYIVFRHRIFKGPIFKNWKLRTAVIAILFLFFTSTYSIFNHTKDNRIASNIPVISKLNNAFNTEWMGFDVNARYKSVLYVWTKQLTTDVISKPSGYSKQAMEELEKKYSRRASEINKSRSQNINDQTVIYVLSESLADPMRVPGVSESQDVLKNIKAIKSKTTSGLMQSDGYGGGTANMEFQSLTGLPMYNYSSSISVLTSEVAPKMSSIPTISNFYKDSDKYVLHPSGAFNYNRKGIYTQLGFKHLVFADDGNEKFTNPKKVGVSISDETTFDNVLERIDPKKNQFFSVITMQNHAPWSVGKPANIVATGKDFSKQQNGSLTEYVRLLSYTDQSVNNFINSLKKVDKDITVVFYGDHLPGLYPDKAFSSKPEAQYQTDYFIWSNKGNKKYNYPLVNSSDFSALLLKQTNSKVSPYYALLTDVLDKASVNQKEKDAEYKEISKDLKLVQYDLTLGRHYVDKKGNFFDIPK